MKNAPRKMLEDFKAGVLGASHISTALMAWLTVAYFVGNFAAGISFSVVSFMEGAVLAGIVLALYGLAVVPALLYMGLDAMAGIERLNRKMDDREYHRRNSR